MDARIASNQNGIIDFEIPGYAAVRASFLHTLKNPLASYWAPLWIACGFAILLAGAWWTLAPVITAMALIALGATGATTNRLAMTPASYVAIALHLFVYVNLYLLFVGAVCHAAVQAPQNQVALPQKLDLLLSVAPMALVVRSSLVAICAGGDAPARG